MAGIWSYGHLTSPCYVFDQSGGLLHLSEDGATTWSHSSTGMPDGCEYVSSVLFSPNYLRDNTLFATLAGFGGESWNEVGRTPEGVAPDWLSLAPLFAKWHVLFTRSSQSALLYRSSDGGSSWQTVTLSSSAPISPPVDTPLQLVYAPDIEVNRPVWALLTWLDYSTLPPRKHGGLYRSLDGGMTWRELAPPTGSSPTALAVAPRFVEDRLLFVGIAKGKVFSVLDSEFLPVGE